MEDIHLSQRVDSTVVILLHIPKTAGTTLRGIVQREYPADKFYYYYRSPDDDEGRQLKAFQDLTPEQRLRYRAMSGHMPFGIHNLFIQKTTYITMLRQPVSRVISQYYFIRSDTQNRNHEKVSAMSLEEFTTTTGRGGNFQTRLLAGEKGDNLNNDPALLEQAKYNLDHHFLTPGLTEYFDESVLIFRKALGWKLPLYASRLVNRKRPKLQQIPTDTIRLIEEYNQLDLELYAYAQQKLQDAIEVYGSEFERELERFRRLNMIYNVPFNIAKRAKILLTRR